MPTGMPSLEDDGAVAVHEDAVLEVPPHGAGEDAAFDFAAEAHPSKPRAASGLGTNVPVPVGQKPYCALSGYCYVQSKRAHYLEGSSR